MHTSLYNNNKVSSLIRFLSFYYFSPFSNSIPNSRASIAITAEGNSTSSDVAKLKDTAPVEREGFLHVKFTILDAKVYETTWQPYTHSPHVNIIQREN